MANDIFNIDAKVIQAAAASFKEIQKNAANAATQALVIEGAMQMVAKARAKMPELKIADPDLAKDVLESTKALEVELVKAGKTVEDLVKARRQEKMLLAGTLIDMENLTREGKKRVKQEGEVLAAKEKYVKVNGELVKVQEEELKKSNTVVSAFKKKGKEIKGYAQQISGIELSLAGIVMWLVEAYDRGNRIGAMTRQISEQFENADGGLAAMNSQIASIRNGFTTTYAVAGEYVKMLSQAGLEKEHIKKLSDDILAQEILGRGTTKQQVEDIKALATNFGVTAEQSHIYLETVKDVSKKIPFLSMDQAVNDWKEMIDKTKAYNTDLLGTLALYNTLMDEEVSEKLGLGDMPRVLKKELAMTVSGFSRDMELGWKAAFGKGETAAESIFEFEGLGLGDQLIRVINFAKKQTGGLVSDDDLLRLRQLLKTQFGPELANELTKKIKEGGFDEANLKKFGDEQERQRKAMEEARKNAEKNREKQIKDAKKVAWKLVGTLEKIKRWFQDLGLKILRLTMAIENFSLNPFSTKNFIYEAFKGPSLMESALAEDRREKRQTRLENIGIYAGANKKQMRRVARFLEKERFSREQMQTAYTMGGGDTLKDLPEELHQETAKQVALANLEVRDLKRIIKALARGEAKNAMNILAKRMDDENWEKSLKKLDETKAYTARQ